MTIDRDEWVKMPWTQRLYLQGVQAWPATYKQFEADDIALEVIGRGLQEIMGRTEVPAVSLLNMLAATKWVHGGCRTITTDEGYFAAMAATKINEDAVDELRIPWPAFVVEIPAGLLVTEAGAEYRHVMVSQFEQIETDVRQGPQPLTAWITVHTDELAEENPTLSELTHGTLADGLARPPKTRAADGGEWLDVDPGDAAVQEMVRRAVVGLLFTMQHTNHFRTKGWRSVVRGAHRDAPPPHRVISIGKPLSVNCVQAVREAAFGGRRRGSPAVQTLVRGHIKRQVVGVGRSGRKVIWVEPYWRGPEDAPILARPYKVQG
jgi:hypothetical protein